MINTGNGLPALIAGARPYTGNAWDFSAVSSSIQVGRDSFIDTLGDTNLSTGITVGMWIKYLFQVNSSASWQRAAGLGGDNTFDAAEFGGNFQVTFAGDDVRTPSVTFSSGNVLDGNWHHVVATFDFQKSSNNAVFYVDGATASTITVPVKGSFSAPGTTMGIGAYSNGQLTWPGQLDQFICYNRALTASRYLRCTQAAR